MSIFLFFILLCSIVLWAILQIDLEENSTGRREDVYTDEGRGIDDPEIPGSGRRMSNRKIEYNNDSIRMIFQDKRFLFEATVEDTLPEMDLAQLMARYRVESQSTTLRKLATDVLKVCSPTRIVEFRGLKTFHGTWYVCVLYMEPMNVKTIHPQYFVIVGWENQHGIKNSLVFENEIKHVALDNARQRAEKKIEQGYRQIFTLYDFEIDICAKLPELPGLQVTPDADKTKTLKRIGGKVSQLGGELGKAISALKDTLTVGTGAAAALSSTKSKDAFLDKLVAKTEKSESEIKGRFASYEKQAEKFRDAVEKAERKKVKDEIKGRRSVDGEDFLLDGARADTESSVKKEPKTWVMEDATSVAESSMAERQESNVTVTKKTTPKVRDGEPLTLKTSLNQRKRSDSDW